MDSLLSDLAELVGREWARRWLEELKLSKRDPVESHLGRENQPDDSHAAESQGARDDLAL